MEIDIMDSMEDLGYSGSLTDKGALKEALELGAKSVEFTKLVSWLSKELQGLCDLESCVNEINDPEESSSFLLEVSSFLKELSCPYDCLMDGPISQRLIEKKNKVLFIDFLCSELQAARLLQDRSQSQKKSALDIEMDSSTTARCLNSMGDLLKVDVNSHESSESIMNAFTLKVEELIKAHPNLLSEPILTDSLTEEQWASLEQFHQDLHSEYKIRREMLLTRLNVTVQSFKWGESSQGKENEIAKTFMPRRSKLKAVPSVDISDILAARDDLTILEKTSSAALVQNTKSSVNRVLIGAVPDRGGRPKEQQPPMEMPSWAKRSHGPSRGGFGGGRGGHGGGGGGGGRDKPKGKRKGGKGGGDDQKHQGAFDAAGNY